MKKINYENSLDNLKKYILEKRGNFYTEVVVGDYHRSYTMYSMDSFMDSLVSKFEGDYYNIIRNYLDEEDFKKFETLQEELENTKNLDHACNIEYQLQELQDKAVAARDWSAFDGDIQQVKDLNDITIKDITFSKVASYGVNDNEIIDELLSEDYLDLQFEVYCWVKINGSVASESIDIIKSDSLNIDYDEMRQCIVYDEE